MNIGISQVLSDPGLVSHEVAARPDATARLLAVIGAAGQRDAPVAAVSTALVAYWCALPRLDRDQRAALIVQVRDAIRRGATTPRAWTCVALGDTDFDIVREATRAYLGTPPVSLERRERSVADVLDWIARELPLNRAAAFAALLDLDDAATLEQAAGYRGRLSHTEAAAVWAACADSAGPAAAEFIAEWRGA